MTDLRNTVRPQAPNATAILILGILSIVLSCLGGGIIGLVLGIIGLILTAQSKRMIRASEESYDESSIKNVEAGRICAIVGVCLGGLLMVFWILYVLFFFSLFTAAVSSSGVPH
jgi:ABC-type antimicrobial peptide transport system permease subunit